MTNKEYVVYDYKDEIFPGSSITVSHSLYLASDADLSFYSKTVRNDLAEKLAESKAKEREIFAKAKAVLAEWAEYAAETAKIENVIEWMDTAPIEHTNNEWREVHRSSSTEHMTRSNAVYKQWYNLYTYTRWRDGEEIPVKYEVSWSVNINHPNKYAEIAGQQNKKFDTLEAAEKYLQGRIKAYNHLFQEEWPVVPAKYKDIFCVNGLLLPGYTVEEENENGN